MLGGGIEHAVTDNILVRFEGLQYEYDDAVDTSLLTSDSDPDDFTRINDLRTFRVGVSYKFGGRAENAPLK